MDIALSKEALDTVIRKSRDHFYKPIQVAEILFRDRIEGDIDLGNLETYRARSRTWRDLVSLQLVGNTSTSSARFQDNLFEANATPPAVLEILGHVNRETQGIVERYIYQCFATRQSRVLEAIAYAASADRETFDLKKFLDLFREVEGLHTSFDKIFEIIAYSLFEVLLSALNFSVEVKTDPEKKELLEEFEDFTRAIASIDSETRSTRSKARLYRVGVSNAADAGLDMWANFGPVIQVKHLELTESLAEDIVEGVSADRMVIVCKASEKNVILSLVSQLGWRSRIQSVVTEEDLTSWYERALRGKFGSDLGDGLLDSIRAELEREYPASANFDGFFSSRGYDKLEDDPEWSAF